MRATVMNKAHDVSIETVPDATIIRPTDALIRITRACICGSDLWQSVWSVPLQKCHHSIDASC